MPDHDWKPPVGGPDDATDATGAGPAPGPTPPVPPVAPPLPPAAPPPYGPPPGYASAPGPYGTAPGSYGTTPGPYGAAPGQYGAAPGPAGWTPPPKPGLLPLRPMSFGTLLWAPFRTLRRNPAPVFGTGLVVQLVSAIASAAVFVPLFFWIFSRVETASEADLDAILSGAVGWVVLLSLVPIAVSVVAAAFLQGVMVVEVASGTLGEKLTFGQLWRRAARRIGPLIGWTLLVGAVVLVVLGLVFGGVIAAAFISPEAALTAAGLAVVAVLGLVVLGAWLGTKLALVPSVIVLERAGIGRSMRRSWALTNGNFWRTFGLILLVGLILSFAAQVVVQPVSLLGTILASVLDPGAGETYLAISIATTIATLVLSILIGAITSVVQAALIAVIYIDLRMRGEGLDLELERHVEARDAGRDVSDPYETVPAAPAGPPTAGTAPTWS
ncbi:glycerophosphoryl diester phosphodiesterase membrane domain-containing protein [Agromyces sp. C10]|uniref:glycerophosphoryl diester phosphodiesterase membrane domain-containing protein n=1 Tax=Agromyces sp. C10 TaxID=2935077 RepID=UPI002009DFA1|nr:glycerophosphoryl diester phosphodiesterase membrane domain-containing protein [Agromyces sp. C10]MCK8608698.1 glycerophosphoryl diester phosphodiesterase membrane domain-containing protein [Agromyces sp. C10]